MTVQYPSPRFSKATIDADPVDDGDAARKGYVDDQIISVTTAFQAQAGVPGGYATLDVDGKVPTPQLPGGLPVVALATPTSNQVQDGTALMPDLVAWSRDSAGTIFEATDVNSTKLLQALQVFGTATLAQANVTAQTVGVLTFEAGDLAQTGSSLVPDLSRWIRGDNNEIVLGIGADGSLVTRAITVTEEASFPGIGVADAPPDAIDITTYGAIGDGATDVFLGTWTSGASTLTITKYSGSVTWAGNVLTLTNLSNTTGPGFESDVVGMSVFVSATDGSGVVETVTIVGLVATTTGVSQSAVVVDSTPGPTVTSADVTWPAFVAGDVGKSIRVEGGATALNRQAYNSGLVPWLGTIATVVDGHSVTVTGPIVSTFSSTNNGRPTRVSWGTDNRGAYIAVGTDLTNSGCRVLYHPRAAGRGKTVYCAFGLAQRGGQENYYMTVSQAATLAYLNAIWIGAPSVVGVLCDAAGVLMPKRLVPAHAPPPSPPTRDIIARLHLPRVIANSTISINEVGDSLAKYDPTNQSDAWFQVNLFEAMIQLQNTHKTFTFANIANVGSGWGELVDPSSGLTWVVPGTDFYYISSSGNNDVWRIHPIKVMVGVNLARGSGNDSGGRPPDVVFTTCVLKGDVPGTPAGGANAWVHEAHLFGEVLLRSMARNQGLGLIDLSWQSEQHMHGGSNFHRELRELPEVNGWSLTSATPYVWSIDCYSWSIQAVLSATNVWTAIGALVIPLSPMPGNVFIVDVDPGTTHLRYEARLWGRSVATTVSTSGSTLTTATGTTLGSSTLTWWAGQNRIVLSGGGFTGLAGQCILLPGLDLNGQTQRSYIAQVLDDQNAIVDDFWWGQAPGTTIDTFTGTVAPVVGGQMFIADDARATVDVVMTWAGGNVYRGKITGFTDQNTVTLSPAPPSLTGQATQMWIGRVSVPQTVTSVVSTGNSVTMHYSLNKDILSVRVNSITSKIFRGAIERWGNRYAPSISMTGGGTVTANFTNQYADRDVLYMPSGTELEIWGDGGANYPGGGGGGHYPSMMIERVVARGYEALDLCAM